MKEQDEILSQLKTHFPSFEKELMIQISEFSTIEKIPANSILMEPGRYVKSLPLLCEGIVEISRNDAEGREVLLYFLKSGEACSAMLSCCMSNFTSEIHAQSMEPCTIIRIPISYINEWLHTYPSWKNFVFAQFRDRFNELLNTIDSLAFLKMDERIIRYFENIHKTTKKSYFEGSHSDIAQSLSTSREVISRLLKSLENQGKVTLHRNRIDFSNLL